MVEGARLESVYTATYRGFESLLLRQNQKKGLLGPFFSFDWGGGFKQPPSRLLSLSHGQRPIGMGDSNFPSSALSTYLAQTNQHPL